LENYKSGSIYLLPAYDEFLVSYKDRTASLGQQATRTTITVNGIFRPVMVVDGKVKGLWKPAIEKDNATFELSLFDTGQKPNHKKLTAAAKRYISFLGAAVKVAHLRQLGFTDK
jgi:hypothetical protein